MVKPMIRWYVMTKKYLNAAGQPTAQCGPYKTRQDAEFYMLKRFQKTDDKTLHVKEQDVHKLAVRPTLIQEAQ